MRVLVTWGSKMGGTEGIARTLGAAMARADVDVTLRDAADVASLEGFDAVVLGGALYANRWAPEARRFARRHEAALRQRPVWVFSSGPLDDSAEHGDIPPSDQVAVICERIGALQHVTFGGRLSPDARGFPAGPMAKKMSGDFRNTAQIERWAERIAAALPAAKPGVCVDHSARSLARQLGYGALAWAGVSLLLLGTLVFSSVRTALIVQGTLGPLWIAAVAWLYFRAWGARDPLPTALCWTALAAALDLALLAPWVEGTVSLFGHFAAGWLLLIATFVQTLVVGGLRSTMPWPDEGKHPVQGQGSA